jgi:Zn-dependent M28 family amino/carboxypeptidase
LIRFRIESKEKPEGKIIMKRILPAFLLLALVLTGCNAPKGTPTSSPSVAVATLAPLGTPAAQYGTEVARPLIRDFTNMGTRTPGSAAEAQAADYIVQIFRAIGYNPETQPFTADTENGTISSANVIAIKQGTSSQELIVGAHYDSIGDGPGADDNASGVAVMLEVAKIVANQITPYTIRFVAFGAEEYGLAGSYAYLNHMSQGGFENIVAMIDLNSLVAGNVAYVFSDEAPQSSIRDWALEWATGNGFNLQTIPSVDLNNPDTGKGYSDFAAFRDAGIPFAYFVSSDWSLGDKNGITQVDPSYGKNGVIRHTADDTLSYLDTTFPGRVDQHLNLYISVLLHVLTQYEAPIQ